MTWHDHKGVVEDSVNGFDVIECDPCGFKHLVPIPTAEELEAVYKHEYYSTEKPLYIERYKEDLDWWNLVYSDRYDSFEELLAPQQRTILDIGSGPGYFLLHGKQRGWSTKGIEPSTHAVTHSRSLGLEIIPDFLTDVSASALGTFDVVHLSNVLEHVPDPVNLIGIAKKMLKPGGLLCVVVPNDYSPFQYALRTVCGYKPWWVAPPHHINYFNVASLTKLLLSQGFDVVLTETTFPLDIFLLMGDNYIGNDALGRQCHAKRMLFEKNLSSAGLKTVKRQLYRDLAKNGLGREVQIIARKTEGAR